MTGLYRGDLNSKSALPRPAFCYEDISYAATRHEGEGSMSNARNSVKISIPLQNNDLGYTVENVWAFECGPDEYQLDNCPFFAYDVSLGDIVLAPKDDISKSPVFKKVVQKSGNRTIRLLFDLAQTPLNEIREILSRLDEYGCGHEGYNNIYYCVNIPPQASYSTILTYLRDVGVDFEEAC